MKYVLSALGAGTLILWGYLRFFDRTTREVRNEMNAERARRVHASKLWLQSFAEHDKRA